jgi:hypothetical protein
VHAEKRLAVSMEFVIQLLSVYLCDGHVAQSTLARCREWP